MGVSTYLMLFKPAWMEQRMEDTSMANDTLECRILGGERFPDQQHGGVSFHACNIVGSFSPRGCISCIVFNDECNDDNNDSGICMRSGEQLLGRAGQS